MPTLDSRSFTDSIAAIARGLRDGPLSDAHLNRAAGQVDHLGRLLHGLDCLRHREIAGCFMAAIAELQVAIGLPETARHDPVRGAVGQLEAALGYSAEGARE